MWSYVFESFRRVHHCRHFSISADGKTLKIKRLKIAEGYIIFQRKQREKLESIMGFSHYLWGVISQISSAYSPIVRSEENFAILAVLIIDFRVQLV